jgi:PelA/Pel-15E family pectate lyase
MKRLLLLIALHAGHGASQAPVTIHLAGDSTMAAKSEDQRPETGWGDALQQYFAPQDVRVVNHAKGGRSTRTFIEDGRWQNLIDDVKAGDYVFIQFAHNDEIPGKTDRYTPPDQYRANLIRFVRETRAKNATPVLLTPVARRQFDEGGNVVDSHRVYSTIMRGVAATERVTLIDTDSSTSALLMQYGVEGSKRLFKHLPPHTHPAYPEGVEDNTHFSPEGAAAVARLVVAAMQEQKLPVAGHLREAPVYGLAWAYPDYGARSDSVRATDRAAIAPGLKPAPTGPGFFLHDSMTAAWLATPAAGALADILVSFQAPNGGWSKRIDVTRPRMPDEGFASSGNQRWVSTLDNGATVEQLRFLGARLKHADSAASRAAYTRGLAYLLAAQYPNGCWPQIYPLGGGYHDAITYNDDAIVGALTVLQSAADSARLPAALRARVEAAVQRGIQCVLMTQVLVNGTRTVWGAQHDPLTLAPVEARAYEHPSLSGRESAAILNFLMTIREPSREVVRAVYNGAEWFRTNAIHGFSYVPRGQLEAQPGAGPLWARFYEIGTNRPIFSDRDGVIRYDLSEVGEERTRGYLWYTDEPATTLRRFERWQRQHPLPSSD